MSSIKELAKEMDIKLPSYAVKPINDMIAKYKKNNKISGNISNKLKKVAFFLQDLPELSKPFVDVVIMSISIILYFLQTLETNLFGL